MIFGLAKGDCLFRIPVRVTSFYQSLAQKAKHPLSKQITPSEDENCEHIDLHWDPLQENAHSPVPYLVHRYPRIALLLVTKQCFAYCRFCFRAGFLKDAETDPTTILDHWEPIAAYLRAHDEIGEVLLSGGDPLTLNDERLFELLRRLREVKPKARIRIGTRAPVFQPKRITRAMLDRMGKVHPVVFYLHVNHPSEITPDFESVIQASLKAGVMCYSQSVLLKGVNDDAKVLQTLLMKLYHLGVHPTYIHLCDMAQGTRHFMVPLKEATQLWRDLWGALPGAAIPHLVFDDAGKGGKIPLIDQVTVKHSPEPCIYSLNQKYVLKYPI